VSAPVFAAPTAAIRAAAASGRLLLDGDEGRHAALVRRLGPGEQVVVTDGAGLTLDGVVATAGKTSLALEVVSVSEHPAPQPRLTVVQALPKGDRGELAVETMTEVGVDALVPWAAERCVTRWRDERGAKALERWRSTAREAAKQSRRAHWPTVTPLAGTDAVADLLAAAGLAVVLHEEAARPLAAAVVPAAGDVVVVVGPEGGLSPAELERFAAVGGTAYRLGPSVLRTSTAGTVAAAVLLAATARWR
jgi:16S rRNA (uracil1498-N3)-methyltransferase